MVLRITGRSTTEATRISTVSVQCVPGQDPWNVAHHPELIRGKGYMITDAIEKQERLAVLGKVRRTGRGRSGFIGKP